MVCKYFLPFCSSSFLSVHSVFLLLFSFFKVLIFLADWVLVVACGIFSCSMRTFIFGLWDLVSWPGIEPGHWTPGKSLLPSSEKQFHCLLARIVFGEQSEVICCCRTVMRLSFSKKSFWEFLFSFGFQQLALSRNGFSLYLSCTVAAVSASFWA